MTDSPTPRRVKVQGDLFHGRIPDGAVYVGRSAPGLKRSTYANPYSLKKHGLDESRRLFREHLLPTLNLPPLRGRDLACWCALDTEWCHADDLLEAANAPRDDFPSGSITGVDGKRYPAAWLPAVDREFLIATVHRFHCAEQMSVRKTVTRIQDVHGIRRSVGWAAGALKYYYCADCSGDPTGTPEHRQGDAP